MDRVGAKDRTLVGILHVSTYVLGAAGVVEAQIGQDRVGALKRELVGITHILRGDIQRGAIVLGAAGVVEAQIEQDRVGALRRELAAVESQLARAERLLAIADPDGWVSLISVGAAPVC